MRNLFLLLLGLSIVPGVARATPPSAAIAAGFDRLVFSEEFTADDLDRKWLKTLWIFKNPSPKRNYVVRKGMVRMTTNDVTDPTALSTQLLTANRAGGRFFRFGYFEARMRWPADKDNWAAFWLEGKPAMFQQHGPNPWCEIDIMEAAHGNQYSSVVHGWAKEHDRTSYPKAASDHFWKVDPTRWHRYGVLWERGKITFYLDGRPQLALTPPSICDENEAFLIVGAQSYNSQRHQSTDVDWVRVWQ